MMITTSLLRAGTHRPVFVGKNRRGNWVAPEQNGLFGGLFLNRAQAFKYGLHPESIIELSHEIALIFPPIQRSRARGTWLDRQSHN